MSNSNNVDANQCVVFTVDKLRSEAQTASRTADPSRLDIRVGRIVSIKKVRRNRMLECANCNCDIL